MKFIILSDSRSGTTTIRETIKQHPKVNVLGEVFHNNRHKYIGKELTNEEYCDLFFKKGSPLSITSLKFLATGLHIDNP